MSDADKAAEILEALIHRARGQIWATEPQLGSKLRRIDFWTLEPQEGKGNLSVSYEIKVSRSDFKRDTAFKQREARLYSDRFFYVAPTGLIKPDELPDWAGLQEWDGKRFKYAVHAPHLSKAAPSWNFVVSILRTSDRVRRDLNVVMQAELGKRFELQTENIALKRQLAAMGKE